MSETTESSHAAPQVVVGVDGTSASVTALRYARAEAARCGAGMDVVHVVPDYAPMAGRYPIPPGDLMADGRAALDAALGQLGPVSKEVATRRRVLRGAAARSLAAAGRGARIVVVGSDRRSVPLRLLTGNVSTGVEARAAVPVVSVPETWDGAHQRGTVLVGIKHADHCEGLLAEAFDLAGQRGGRLVVLHAWQFPDAYDDNLLSDREMFQAWQARAASELKELVAPWRARRREVEVELRSVHGQAAQALVAASAEVDELVIARRAHGVPAATHLGATARTVLRHAECPVRVVPGAAARAVPDQDLDLKAAATPLT